MYRSVVSVVFALVLVLTACGDDGGSGGDASGGGDPTGESSEPDSGTGGDAESGSLPEVSLPNDLADLFSGDCADAIAAFQRALAESASAFVPGQDVDLGDTAELLDEFAASAPDEIAEDFGLLADAFSQFAQAMSDAGIDFSDPTTFQDPDLLNELESLTEAFDAPGYDEAAANVEDWFNNNCGG